MFNIRRFLIDMNYSSLEVSLEENYRNCKPTGGIAPDRQFFLIHLKNFMFKKSINNV
jgi:hypothetical protein